MKELLPLLILSIVIMSALAIFFVIIQLKASKILIQKERQIAKTKLDHQKKLLETELISQEKERGRVGNDLHDEIGAALSTLRLILSKEKLKEFTAINKSKELIDQILLRVREISHNLSPLTNSEHALYYALDNIFLKLSESNKYVIKLNYNEDNIPSYLDNTIAIPIYRIISELLNNTIKHASAKEIGLEILTKNNTITMVYTDDGIGIDSNQKTSKGMGLFNIESRLALLQARWNIDNQIQKGFKIVIQIPLLHLNKNPET